ncbi:MAG: hypothetical protein R3E97_16670 [Candidatus Eisenbacteria bacterium]
MIMTAIAVALLFVAFATWVHYNLDQAPHRMFKILAGVVVAVLLLVRTEYTIYLIPFILPYSEVLPKSPIPFANSANLLLGSMILSWVGRSVLLGRTVFDWSPWNKPLAFFWGWVALSTVYGAFTLGNGPSDLYPAFQGLWSQAMGFVLFFTTFNTVRTRDQIRRLAVLYCVGAGLGALGVLREYGEYSYGRRVGGGMGDINGAGAYFAGAVLVTLEMIAAKAQKAWSRLLLVGALVGHRRPHPACIERRDRRVRGQVRVPGAPRGQSNRSRVIFAGVSFLVLVRIT